ncbi:hypothetical protein BJ875DRAFT_423736 [Amylocarpus encephaloides]|uniref:Bromo domain-containing protein n=1 Tax=Amylocarpus encephaloides TaxID=45428 RepID=A0A9P7YJ59_9HELO|nr:hypothetical protein BJ875DRAFT_423736 [Amylocarpus encephaloides]
MNTTALLTNAHAYTPLECLLLFQCLLSYGSRDEDFARISHDLTTSPLVKDAPTYDPQRLSADALRQLYVQLLQEEVKLEGQEQEVQEDGTQAGSRKRKIPSPTLPLLKDLRQHNHKLPMVVDRLYARYKDLMVKAIREDEKKFKLLQQEIHEIERGERDKQILEEDQEIARRIENERRNAAVRPETTRTEPSRPKTNGTEAASTPTPPSPVPEPQRVHVEQKPVEVQQPTSIKPPVLAPARPPPNAVPPPLAAQPAQIQPRPDLGKDGIAHQPSPSTTSPQLASSRSPNGVQSIVPPPKPQRQNSNGFHGPQFQQGPPIQPQSGHGTQLKWEQPWGPSHQPPPPHYQPQSPQQHYNGPQFPPHFAPPARGPFTQQHGLPPPHPHVPSSPSPLNSQHPSPLNTQHPQSVHLPPPNPTRPSPISPGQPLDALADAAGQQYRAASGSPMAPQPPQMQPQPHHQQQMKSPMQPPAGYAMPGPQTPFSMQAPPMQQFPQRPSGPNTPQQWNQHHVPQYQGQPYPPQFQPPPNPRAAYPPPPPPTQPENRQYNSPYNANQGPKASQPLASQPVQKLRQSSHPNTPASKNMPRIITGSGTRWTPTPTPSTPRPESGMDIRAPQVEPLSPIIGLAPTPVTSRKGSPKKERKKEPQKSEATKVTKPRRGGPRKRAGSTASSVIAGSHRSPSVASPAEDQESAGRHVKEEVATPSGLDVVGDTAADEAPEPPPSRPRGRQLNTKRKRAPSVSASVTASPPPESHISSPPTQVLWTRNFPKISASALDAVSAHRNASTFAAPVKERDAPGYKSIILQAQDLKSIRMSIVAGQRAATAAAPADMNPSATNVWLPISEELVPPKGIINNGQLEKELMRMFANAAMYNADPDRGLPRRLRSLDGGTTGDVLGYDIDEDGYVKDTRAMFVDVEKIIIELRSAERRSEELREASLAAGTVPSREDEDETASVIGEGESGGSVAKRRRKA